MTDNELVTEINKMGISFDTVISFVRVLKSLQSPYTYTHAENMVMAYYPQFKTDYQKLIDNGYMQKDGDYLKWIKSKKSLAEYFGYCQSKDNKSHWKDIELLFSQKGLYQSFLNAQTLNQSRDYKNLLEILSKQNLVVSK